MASATQLQSWNPAHAAAVICDMWDAHHCVTAERRTAAMAPRMNTVVNTLRAAGALIIHAPAGGTAFYAGTAARIRAIDAPVAPVPCVVDWNDWEPAEASALPESLTNPGACMCATNAPCGSGEPPYPWTRQTPLIEITSDDAVTDDGREVRTRSTVIRAGRSGVTNGSSLTSSGGGVRA